MHPRYILNKNKKVEQLSIVVMYYYYWELKEQFLEFIYFIDLNANSLFLKIKQMFSKCDIDINNYDATSVCGTI